MRESRRSGDHMPRSNSAGLQEVVARNQVIHWVSQNGKFRLEMNGSSHSERGEKNRDQIRAFDGTTTRLLDQREVANIIKGETWDHNSIQPHMLLMRYSTHAFPLSTLLGGNQDKYRHPAWSAPSSSSERRVEHTRMDTFKDLKCHVVTVSTYNKKRDTISSRREYWLAEERNFVPVRLLSYSDRASNDVPSGEGVVDEFREVKPGVWFPTKAHFTSYEKLNLKSKGVQKLQWQETYDALAVSLDPRYDQAFFSTLEFPIGVAVYEVEDGKVKNSYRVEEGTPSPKKEKPDSDLNQSDR